MNKYNTLDIIDRITYFIMQRHEGAYWDFKQQWHSNKAELLHDILCMANNLQDEDGFIIFGVQDNCEVCGVNRDDSNRLKQTDVLDWLSQLAFANDFPAVQVFSNVPYSDNLVDVLIVIQKNNGPYYLKENYPRDKITVRPFIYTRVGDKNTPVTEPATFSQIETLWRKRFGMLYDVQERAVKYVYDIGNWNHIESIDADKCLWYYKGDPSYTISSYFTDETDGIEKVKYINSNFYYLCSFYNISYHQGIMFENILLKYNDMHLFEALVDMIDECRTKVVDCLGVYGYYVKGTLEHAMYEFVFEHMCGSYSNEAKMQIERIIPIYENYEEKEEFGAAIDTINNYNIYIPQNINFFSDRGCKSDNIIKEQEKGFIVNYYNEDDFSKEEQAEISRRMKDGYRTVEMLKQWRRERNANP